MMNKTPVKILELNTDDENEVLLQIGSSEIRCFISHCPNMISAGEEHLVNLSMYIDDEHTIKETDNLSPYIKNLNNGYSVEIAGHLSSGTFQSIIDLDDKDIHYDHPDLNDKFVIVNADRLQVEFN